GHRPPPALFPYTTLFRSARRRPGSKSAGSDGRDPRSARRRSPGSPPFWQARGSYSCPRLRSFGVLQLADRLLADRLVATSQEVRSEEHTSELQSRENLVC